MEVGLLGYQNPTQMCQQCVSNGQRRCCDSNEISGCIAWRRCDTYFTYCLRTFGDEDSQEGACPDPLGTRSSKNIDDQPTDFSQARVLGLDNPFRLQGLRSDYMVSNFSLTKVFCCSYIFVVVHV